MSSFLLSKGFWYNIPFCCTNNPDILKVHFYWPSNPTVWILCWYLFYFLCNNGTIWVTLLPYYFSSFLSSNHATVWVFSTFPSILDILILLISLIIMLIILWPSVEKVPLRKERSPEILSFCFTFYFETTAGKTKIINIMLLDEYFFTFPSTSQALLLSYESCHLKSPRPSRRRFHAPSVLPNGGTVRGAVEMELGLIWNTVSYKRGIQPPLNHWYEMNCE